MTKVYFILDDHYDCIDDHYNYKPYSQDKGLITLGYALIASDSFRGKEKYNTFIQQPDKAQESFDLRCCYSPAMQVVFTRYGKDFLLELQDGWFESVDESGSDIFHKAKEPIALESWDAVQGWVRREPEKKEDTSIKIDQIIFIKLAQEFRQINKRPRAIELIQHENGSFSFFYQK